MRMYCLGGSVMFQFLGSCECYPCCWIGGLIRPDESVHFDLLYVVAVVVGETKCVS
jgi:hypothetical protein